MNELCSSYSNSLISQDYIVMLFSVSFLDILTGAFKNPVCWSSSCKPERHWNEPKWVNVLFNTTKNITWYTSLSMLLSISASKNVRDVGPESKGGVRCIRASPDGLLLAVGERSGNVR